MNPETMSNGVAGMAWGGGAWRVLALVAALAGRALGAGWDAASFPVGSDTSRVYTSMLADGFGGVWMGGSFTEIGDISASHVARWDGQRWQSLGPFRAEGVNGPVMTMAQGTNGVVYVGGQFSLAGGKPAWNVARWDGSGWSTLGSGLMGSGSAVVRALAVSEDGRLYAGGTFRESNGVVLDNVAVWDGQRWSALEGGGIVGDGVSEATVHALAWRGSRLWVGGQFSRAGGIEASALAQWDGRGWRAVGGGVGFPGFLPFVRTLAVRGNDVFVGGRFTEVGGVSVSNVARWDGVGWHAAGAGTDGAISVLRALGPDLMAAGAFTTAGAGTASGIARWNGQDWQALGGGVGGFEPVVTTMDAGPAGLWVAGTFTSAGGNPATRSARWVPTNLPPVGRVVSPIPGTRLQVDSVGGQARATLALEASDPDGQVVRVEWHDGPQRLAVAEAAPFAFEATGLVRGPHLFWARLVDAQGSVSETLPVEVEVDTPNLPPTVRMISPAGGARLEEGERVVFQAVASDADGRVVRVDFQTAAGAPLASVSGEPFEYVIPSAVPGPLQVRAVAVDDRGARAVSDTVAVQVNARPRVRIASPIDGAVATVTNEVRIVVEAGDADGRIERLTLLRDGQVFASTTVEPYRFTLVNLPAGTNTYRVVAVDDMGSKATSAPVTIQHLAVPLPYGPPKTYLVAPVPDTILTAPAEVVLEAETLTQGAAFQYHQFLVSGHGFQSVVLNNTFSTDNPARWGVSNLAVGTYEFAAVGWDIFGGRATSAPVAVTVRAPALTERYRLAVTSGLGGDYPVATGLAPDGTVVGYSDLDRGSARVHAFRWKSGILTDVTPAWDRSEAWDVNGSGTILGYAMVEDPVWNGMFLLDSAGGLRKASGPGALPLAMNAAGQVVGRTRPGVDWPRPFRWTGTGAIEVLGSMEGEARDINGQGRIVGWRRAPGEPTRAFLWQDGQFTTLSVEASQAWGINEVGQIVGVLGESDFERRAVLWSGGEARILGGLPGHNSQAAAINHAGSVVGWGRPLGPNADDRAMLWKDGVAHDLNALVDGLDGRRLSQAVAINDRGQIAGVLLDPRNFKWSVFLATPVSVAAPTGAAPVVQWVSPSPEVVRPRVGLPLEWAVEVADADSALARVEFRLGKVVVGTLNQAPFRISWVPEQAGNACLSVVAWDVDGNVTETASRCFDVLPAPAPFEVVDLGALADVDGRASGINASGDLVGFTRDEGFLDVAGVTTYLRWNGATQPVSIGDDGTVA
jgi:hypothetical protein